MSANKENATRPSLKRGSQATIDIATLNKRIRRAKDSAVDFSKQDFKRGVLLTVNFDYDGFSKENPTHELNFRRLSADMRKLFGEKYYFETDSLILPSNKDNPIQTQSLRDNQAEGLFQTKCIEWAQKYNQPGDLVIFNPRTHGNGSAPDPGVLYLCSGEYHDPWKVAEGDPPNDTNKTCTKVLYDSVREAFEHSKATLVQLIDGCHAYRAMNDNKHHILAAVGIDETAHSGPSGYGHHLYNLFSQAVEMEAWHSVATLHSSLAGAYRDGTLIDFPIWQHGQRQGVRTVDVWIKPIPTAEELTLPLRERNINVPAMRNLDRASRRAAGATVLLAIHTPCLTEHDVQLLETTISSVSSNLKNMDVQVNCGLGKIEPKTFEGGSVHFMLQLDVMIWHWLEPDPAIRYVALLKPLQFSFNDVQLLIETYGTELVEEKKEPKKEVKNDENIKRNWVGSALRKVTPPYKIFSRERVDENARPGGSENQRPTAQLVKSRPRPSVDTPRPSMQLGRWGSGDM